MDNIQKNASITFSSQILLFIMGLIASIILARALGPKGKGIYTLTMLIPNVILKVGTFGLNTSNVYFIANKKYRTKEIVSISFMSSIILGIFFILTAFTIFNFENFQNFLKSNHINFYYLMIVVCTIPFSLITIFLRNVFLGKEKIIIFNKINIINNILQLILIIFLVLIFKKGIFGAIIAHVIVVICIALYVILLIRRDIKINNILYYNTKMIKDMFKYGLKSYFGNLIQFLNYRLDMFLVAFFLTPTAVGYYSISVGIAEKLWMLPGSIATVLFPRISSIKDIEANSLTPRVSRHTFFIMIILSMIFVIGAKSLIRILFGTEFLPSVKALLILLPGIVALGGSKILSADLAGRGKPEFGLYAALVSLLVNIPLNLWLIPKWGISGAAFASSIAYIIATLIISISFIRFSNNTWLDVFFIKKTDFIEYKKLFNKSIRIFSI